MNNFSNFDIKPPERGFDGDKIRMAKVLNREITVLAFKIVDSTVAAFQQKGNDKCMHLHISMKDEKYIIFTSSGCLMDAIQQIPAGGFPFTATIIQDDKRFLFT